VGLLLVYMSVALAVSFLCSIVEAALLSVTPSFVALHVQQGHAWARRLERLKDDIDRPLAAILSLNTIAHTVGAAGAGAQAAAVFGNAYLGLASAALTLLILVFSEIIPKTVGALYWQRLAPAVALVLRPMIWLMWPLVVMSKVLTRVLSRGARPQAISREEMRALAEVGQREGAIDESESRVMERLLRFPSLRVRDVMTPRTVVAALRQDTTVGDAIGREEAMRFSRIPVFAADLDDVTGFVLKDEVLLRAARDDLDTPLVALRRELPAVPETLPLPALLDRLLADGDHIALVFDEHGGTEGVVTLEDVVETLLGLEIVDEADAVRDMQALARARWRERHPRLERRARDAAARLGLTGGHPVPSRDDEPTGTP